jgi:hypothetical protein
MLYVNIIKIFQSVKLLFKKLLTILLVLSTSNKFIDIGTNRI